MANGICRLICLRVAQEKNWAMVEWRQQHQRFSNGPGRRWRSLEVSGDSGGRRCFNFRSPEETFHPHIYLGNVRRFVLWNWIPLRGSLYFNTKYLFSPQFFPHVMFTFIAHFYSTFIAHLYSTCKLHSSTSKDEIEKYMLACKEIQNLDIVAWSPCGCNGTPTDLLSIHNQLVML